MGPTRINTILQSAFFKLANIIPEESDRTDEGCCKGNLRP